MADLVHRHIHDAPLPRRLFRLTMVSIIVVAFVMIIQGLVLYVAMPKVSKATHQARAACSSFVSWIDSDGVTGAPEAAGDLRKATASARSAASLEPKRWSKLRATMSAVAAPSPADSVAGPGIVTPRTQAISDAISLCKPVMPKPPQ